MEFSTPEYWSGWSFPSLGGLPNPGILHCRRILYQLSHQGSPLIHMLLLLLSRFSRVRLCAAPETAALQASPSPGFSRQECWSGLSFPSPMHESEKGKGSHSVVPDSGDPMDCRLPGPSIHGIFQARVLEWDAIALLIREI